MATRKKAAGKDVEADNNPRKGRSTEKVNVWLPPDQAAWLKAKKNISETVRALITEAMNMENLAKSVKTAKKK